MPVPPSVNAPAVLSNVIEFSVSAVFSCGARLLRPPKIRTSSRVGDCAGFQLAGLLMLPPPPAPVHVSVAAFDAAAETSAVRAQTARNKTLNRDRTINAIAD